MSAPTDLERRLATCHPGIVAGPTVPSVAQAPLWRMGATNLRQCLHSSAENVPLGMRGVTPLTIDPQPQAPAPLWTSAPPG